jgi:hypothetical protein
MDLTSCYLEGAYAETVRQPLRKTTWQMKQSLIQAHPIVEE